MSVPLFVGTQVGFVTSSFETSKTGYEPVS
jgi:hypothetical protein